MTNFNAGDIALLPFPFTDLQTTKKRPALILTKIAPAKKLPHLYIVAMITSQIGAHALTGDVLLKNWKECGLLVESKIRLAKVVTVEEKLFLKKIGAIPSKNMSKILAEFCALIQS